MQLNETLIDFSSGDCDNYKMIRNNQRLLTLINEIITDSKGLTNFL